MPYIIVRESYIQTSCTVDGLPLNEIRYRQTDGQTDRRTDIQTSCTVDGLPLNEIR